MIDMLRKAAALAMAVFTAFGPVMSYAAEFEVTDKLTVDGYSLMKTSATITGTGVTGTSPVFTVASTMTVLGNGNFGVGTLTPQGRIDVVSAGGSPSNMATIWRNAGSVVVGSMSATGVMKAVKFIGDGTEITGIPAAFIASATDLIGGSIGAIHYQTSLTDTDFLAPGTANYVLQSNGAAVPGWVQSTSAIANNSIVRRDATGSFSGNVITANSFVGAISGNSGTATIAANLAGGAAGSLPYQAAADSTLMLTASPGYVLKSGAAAPSWSNLIYDSGTGVGIGAGASAGSTLDVGGTSNSAFIQNLATWGLNARSQGLIIMPEGTVTDNGAGNLTFGSTLIVMDPLSGSYFRVAAGTYALGGFSALYVNIPPTSTRGATVTPTVKSWTDGDVNYLNRDALLLAQRTGGGPVFTRFGNRASYNDSTGTNYFGANVGIGMVNPGVKLTTRSGTNALPATTGSAQTAAGLRVEGGDNAVIDMGANSVNTWIQATDKSALGSNYYLLLNPNGGNVGINKSAPGTPLDVNGTATATLFSGPLNGNATTATRATNLAGGAAASMPYQSAAGTTAMLATTTAGYMLTSGAAAPTWTNSTSANTASAIVQRDASGNFTAATISATSFVGSISGNSGTATTATNAQFLNSEDNRAIAPSELPANNMRFGFTSWANNNTAPYADFVHLRSYQDASGGNDNLVMFRKDAIGMRIWQQAYGSATAYSSYKDMAFTDGTNATGTWGISITGNAKTATTATHLAGGAAASIPYQTVANTTAMLATATAGYLLTAGAAAPTWTNSTSLNTGGAVVKRDGSGNFTAGTISATTFTGALNGNALTATKLNSQGNYDANTPGTTRGPSGLNLFQVYTNNYPIPYGNVLHMNGVGGGQLLLGWSGTDGAHANNYVRSKRDNDSGIWSPWALLLTDQNFNSYAPTLTGGGASGASWAIGITGNAATATTATHLAGGAIGSVPYQNAVNTTAMLSAGSASYVLTGAGAAAPVWTNATNLSTASSIVRRDSSGNFTAGTISAASFVGSLGWSSITSRPIWMQSTNLIATLDDANTASISGFYEKSNGTNYPPTAGDYYLLNVRHAALGSTYGMQITAASGTENFWTRTYSGGSGSGEDGAFTTWKRLVREEAGPWAINISGKAATAGTADTATNATNASNADTVDNLHVNSTTTNNEANKVVRTDANGYTNFGWINTVSGDNNTTAINRVYASQDAYLRYYTLANFTAQVRGAASGTWPVDISGSADKLDTYHASQLQYFQSDRDFASGTLIQSNIDYSVANGEPFLLEIEGNSYGGQLPFDIKVQGYIYSSTIINYGGISVGSNLTGLVALNYNGKLCFWFPRQSYWQGFNVFVNSSYGGVKNNRLVSVSDSAKPAGTKEVAFTIQQAIRSDTIGSQSVAYASNAGNATTATTATTAATATTATTAATATNSYACSADGTCETQAISASGNLSFTAANPTISASSYFIAPGGAYFNSGTVYTEAAIQARGGVHNDNAAYLTISGGSSGYTYFPGSVGIGNTAPSGGALEVAGNIYLDNVTTGRRDIRGTMGDNDYWSVGANSIGSNTGVLELATGDDGQSAGGAEPIVVRQYGPGSPWGGTLVRTGYLLDTSGNTSFPGTVTAPTFSGALSGNATTATTANNATNATNTQYMTFQQHTGNWAADFNSIAAASRGFAEQSAGGPQGTWWFMDNFRHSNASNYWGTQVAWGWEDNANQLWQRNVSGGGWSGWVKYLNSSNYNNYSPTLTGGGASGSWAITAANANLVNGTYTGGGGLQPPSYIPSAQVRFNMMAGVPGTSGYQDWLMMDTYGGGDVPYVTMIGVSKTGGSPVGYLAVGPKGGATWTSTPLITGANIGSQTVATASNADTVDGHHFYWSGQGGQPTWMWGGNDSASMYVYNPSNFSVNYANYTGNANACSNDGQCEFPNSTYVNSSGNFQRSSHSTGYFVGSYNNVGSNDSKSNPIYVIGTSYQPSDTALNGMYGIGFSHSNFWGGRSSGWGLYQASGGYVYNTISDGGMWSAGTIVAQGTVYSNSKPVLTKVVTTVSCQGGTIDCTPPVCPTGTTTDLGAYCGGNHSCYRQCCWGSD